VTVLDLVAGYTYAHILATRSTRLALSHNPTGLILLPGKCATQRSSTIQNMTVAKANFAQIEGQLGAAVLEYAPYEKVRDCQQSYDSRAISFKLLFGYIFDKRSNKRQEVWVLLYPPTQEGRHAEVQFHSIHHETGEFVKHDDSNISNTISALADAFNNPKKAAKSKHVALAKYYYLKALAARETKSGRASELKISIPITRTFVESLRVVCREFEVEAKEKLSEMLSQSSSATLVDDDDSDLSDPPEDLMEPGSTITPEISPIPVSKMSTFNCTPKLISVDS
jgi:hypothetical protein